MDKCVECGKGGLFTLINSEGRCEDCEIAYRREKRRKNNGFEISSVMLEEPQKYNTSSAPQAKKRSNAVLLYITVFLCSFIFFAACYLFYVWIYDDDSAKPLNSSNITIQDPALADAIIYLSSMPFSEEGLVEQLIYEGYSEEEATNAVKNCGADWKEQALLKALDYLDSSAFSDESLTDQLIYEGFSEIEADYAVDRCGADWKEQASIKAAQYLEISTFTRDELISQLEYEGFSSEEAIYGVQANGL